MSKPFKILRNSQPRKLIDYDECYLIQFDGLAAPNPGQCTAGAVGFHPVSLSSKTDRDLLFEVGKYVGIGTNNQGEYMGLLIGLYMADNLKLKHIIIEGDSNLIVNQVSGDWATRDPILQAINEEIQKYIKKFDFVAIRHIYREYNSHADSLTNEVLKIKEDFIRTF
jgi:ribonuclease HI